MLVVKSLLLTVDAKGRCEVCGQKCGTGYIFSLSALCLSPAFVMPPYLSLIVNMLLRRLNWSVCCHTIDLQFAASSIAWHSAGPKSKKLIYYHHFSDNLFKPIPSQRLSFYHLFVVQTFLNPSPPDLIWLQLCTLKVVGV